MMLKITIAANFAGDNGGYHVMPFGATPSEAKMVIIALYVKLFSCSTPVHVNF